MSKKGKETSAVPDDSSQFVMDERREDHRRARRAYDNSCYKTGTIGIKKGHITSLLTRRKNKLIRLKQDLEKIRK
jgi:hypothetical protein